MCSYIQASLNLPDSSTNSIEAMATQAPSSQDPGYILLQLHFYCYSGQPGYIYTCCSHTSQLQYKHILIRSSIRLSNVLPVWVNCSTAKPMHLNIMSQAPQNCKWLKKSRDFCFLKKKRFWDANFGAVRFQLGHNFKLFSATTRARNICLFLKEI